MNIRFTAKLLLLFILPAIHLQAQDSLFARRVLDTLTSPSLDGRGYLKDGANKAARYISDRFKQFHLQAFGTTGYYQPFTMDVNTFPGTLSVKLNDQQLKNGKDFLVAPYSSGCSGDYAVNYPDWLALYQSAGRRKIKFSPNTFNVLDKTALSKDIYNIILKLIQDNNNFGAKGLIELTTDKLTWDISEEVKSFTHLIVRKDSVPKNLKTISIQLENKFLPNYPTQNVIGYVKGKTKPDSFIVLSAHYDHLGQMGDGTYFPGANDNASGISMLLSLASYYSQPAYQPKYSIVFMAFSGEEVGLVGSKYYTKHPLFPLSSIRFLVNMDIVGTGEEGITVVNGSLFQSQFDKLVKLNDEHHYLKLVKVRGKAANSDHYFFTESGVPAFFIYTMGGISAYHDVFDRDATLPLNKFNSLELLLKAFVASF